MPGFTRFVVTAAGAVLVTATAVQAQTIAGTVRDDSGAVLPGVTVEVSSPALIEKVRTAVTDGTGQYRIVSLSAGAYSVTFALSGFSTLKRAGIELTGNFTAQVNADMKVGALEETITVSGASPMVDVQSLTKQTVFTREMLDALPAARSIQGAGDMEIREAQPFAREPVDVRRWREFSTVAAEIARTEIVGEEEDDVRRHCIRSPPHGCEERCGEKSEEAKCVHAAAHISPARSNVNAAQRPSSARRCCAKAPVLL